MHDVLTLFYVETQGEHEFRLKSSDKMFWRVSRDSLQQCSCGCQRGAKNIIDVRKLQSYSDEDSVEDLFFSKRIFTKERVQVRINADKERFDDIWMTWSTRNKFRYIYMEIESRKLD